MNLLLTDTMSLLLLTSYGGLFIFLMQEVETYFSEGLTKWRDLNLTENFSMYKQHNLLYSSLFSIKRCCEFGANIK